MKKWFPIAFTLLLTAWILSRLGGPKEAAEGPPLVGFGQLPVLKEGRKQPLDSLARNALLILRKKQTLNLEPWKGTFEKPEIVPAIQWMMELMMDAKTADTRPAFRIDNDDLKNLLHLPTMDDETARTDGKHFSWNQINAHKIAFLSEAQRASKVKSESRNAYERSLMDLWEATSLYRSLRSALGPAAQGDLADTLVPYQDKIREAGKAFQAQMNGEPFDSTLLDWARDEVEGGTPLILPPATIDKQWSKAVSEVIALRGEAPPEALTAYGKMTAAYRAKDWAGMSKVITGYLEGLRKIDARFTEEAEKLEKVRDAIKGDSDPEKVQREALKRDLVTFYNNSPGVAKVKSELDFNYLELFYRGMIASVLAFLFTLLVWFNPVRFEWARKSAIWLTVLILAVLVWGLIWRMLHEGRPPVTNLYSSALFIGMAAVALGLILELVFPYSIGVAVSSWIAFATLILAHFLALDGDTMIMLRAVLDTNFWLATHVVTVTLGYAATFVAGFIGFFAVLRAVFTRHITVKMQRAFAGMVFAIICFASLFSFVGTVLGGIWADQSWGRFWGWDPKENGALIIVLWNVMVLHARLGGLVRERGMFVLAIGGNIVTSWSWFGTNMLNIGLHSYGFMGAAYWSLWIFVFINVIIMIIGSTPRKMWLSFQAPRDPAAPPPSPEEPAPAA